MRVTNKDSKVGDAILVTLDGKELDTCYLADDELGYVDIVEDMKAFNNFAISEKDLPFVRKYGNVVIKHLNR